MSIPAPSTTTGLLAEPGTQDISVVLPATDLAATSASGGYPVIYYLTGFDDPTDIAADAFRLGLEATGAQVIVVVATGNNQLGGSFFADSPVTGNWATYVTTDLVGYVDAHYPTDARPSARAISGHSMGGAGALALAMERPDVFGALYILSPALFGADGLAHSDLFRSRTQIGRQLDVIHELTALGRDEAINQFAALTRAPGYWIGFAFAYGATFAPKPDSASLIDFPYQAADAQPDPRIWTRWESGVGALEQRVARYGDALRSLSGIGIDYGTRDELEWIPPACEELDAALTAAGITHVTARFPGRHNDAMPERITDHLLPFLVERLTSAIMAQ